MNSPTAPSRGTRIIPILLRGGPWLTNSALYLGFFYLIAHHNRMGLNGSTVKTPSLSLD